MLFDTEFNIWSDDATGWTEEEIDVADSLVKLSVSTGSLQSKPDGRGQSTGKYFAELKKIISENKGITIEQARALYHINKRKNQSK
jgi:hypothetical protein